MALIKCSECGNQVSDKATACPNCGAPVAAGPQCPECGSRDIGRISGLKKGLSAYFVGPFAARTVLNNYECHSCGAKFN